MRGESERSTDTTGANTRDHRSAPHRAAGQVDQIGCIGTEPVATPVAADTLRPFGKSWRGHFATPTSDDTLVWFTTGDFMLSTRSDGEVKTVATRSEVVEADCVQLGAPAALEFLIRDDPSISWPRATTRGSGSVR